MCSPGFERGGKHSATSLFDLHPTTYANTLNEPIQSAVAASLCAHSKSLRFGGAVQIFPNDHLHGFEQILGNQIRLLGPVRALMFPLAATVSAQNKH